MYNGQQRGEPSGWDMKIFGTPDRLLDSVLPHEITHTIFATHFRRPLPRWADEGACTTVEHVAEKEKNHGMLIHFLTARPSRGIPFNRMFTMKDYPQDILPLYAQGYSVAKFLIMEKGRRHFLDYVSAGMEREQPGRELESWNQATKRYYGFENLSDLQVAWSRWVADGSKLKEIPENAPLQIATNQNTLGTNGRERFSREPVDRSTAVARQPLSQGQLDNGQDSLRSLNQGWYSKQMTVGRGYRPQQPSSDASDPSPRDASSAVGQTIWR